MGIKSICFGLCISISLTGAAVAASVTKEFRTLWLDRQSSYETQWSASNENAKTASLKAANAIARAEPTFQQDLVSAFDAIFVAAILQGKRALIFRFLQHMDRKPSSALSEAWIQGQVDELKSDQTKLDVKVKSLQSKKVGVDIDVNAAISDMEVIVIERASLKGRLDELALIDQNLVSFYRAKGEETQRRQAARAAFFQAFGNSLAAQQQSNRMWVANCNAMGNHVTCVGN